MRRVHKTRQLAGWGGTPITSYMHLQDPEILSQQAAQHLHLTPTLPPSGTPLPRPHPCLHTLLRCFDGATFLREVQSEDSISSKTKNPFLGSA